MHTDSKILVGKPPLYPSSKIGNIKGVKILLANEEVIRAIILSFYTTLAETDTSKILCNT